MASPAGRPSVFRFGAFDLDAAAGELRKGGIPLKLHPQPFRVLTLLTGRLGEVVTREEIQECLWGSNTFVDFDRGINFCISQIRTALADDAENPRYIETVPRRGYRFIATNGLFVAPTSSVAAPRAATPEPAAGPRSVEAPRSSESPSKQNIHVVPAFVETRARNWGRRIALTAVAMVLIVVAATWSVLRFRGSPKLTEKDTVLLADFNNTTGDPVFDDALKQGLAVQLSQSPFLNILSDGTVRDTLKLMGRSPDERLTAPVTREVCRRTENKAYFTGSIANLNSQYVIGLNLVNCETDGVLAREQVTARGKEEVLRALDGAAARIRQRAGESLASLQRFDMPIEQATTGSLEALQAYSAGKSMLLKNDPIAAIPLFQRAIQLDSNFAMAYASLGAAYGKLHESGHAAENETKAYELQERTSEREKFYIAAHYYVFVTGNLKDARETYELWAHTYPRDAMPEGNLGPVYDDLGEPEKRLEVNLRAIQLDPEGSSGYSGATDAYLELNRFDEAQALGQRALTKGIDSYALRLSLYHLAFCQKDAAGMAEQVRWAMGKPGIEDLFLAEEAQAAAYFGHLKQARELFRRASESAIRSEDQERAGTNSALLALLEANVGNDALAKQDVASALSEGHGDLNIRSLAAEILARVGDSAGAATILSKLVKEFPQDTGINSVVRPTVVATTNLREGNASKAVETLREVSPYELSGEDSLYSAYLRGLAYLRLHDCQAAAGEFERIVSHEGVTSNNIIGVLARLQLARAYARQEDASKARAEYETLIVLWNGADPGFRPLKEAKTECAKLN